MNSEFYVEVISSSKGNFKCAVFNKEGKKKYKFTLNYTEEDLHNGIEDLIFRTQITRNAVERDFIEHIAGDIMEKCEDFREGLDYGELVRSR